MKRANKQKGRMYYFFNGIEMQLMKDTGTEEDKSRYDIGNYFDAANSKNARFMQTILEQVFNQVK